MYQKINKKEKAKRGRDKPQDIIVIMSRISPRMIN